MSKVKVIPCSGIGKVLGLLSRETVLEVTGNLIPDKAETVCLAYIVTGDDDANKRVEGVSCISVDGCSALCAAKSIEAAGGIVREKYRVIDEMKNHRGKNAGTGTELTDEGWEIVDTFASKIAESAIKIYEEENENE